MDSPAPVTAHAAIRHYDALAPTYAEASGRGVWRWFRTMETRAVLRLAQPQPGESILDAGAGAGHYTEVLHRLGARVTALDGSAAMLAALRSRLDVQTIKADLMSVHLEPRFDKVVCLGVLEFVPDPARALANLAAALRPGGPAQITILVPSTTLGRFYQATHRRRGVPVRVFSRRSLQSLATAAGLTLSATTSATFNLIARFDRRSP